MDVKAKVMVIFTCDKPDVPSWPYINYDYGGRAREIMEKLRENMPSIEFSEYLLSSKEELEKIDWKGKEIDGFVVYMIGGMWTGVAEAIIETGSPVVLVDDLYAGSGGFLRAFSKAGREQHRVVAIGSSNFRDILGAVSLFKVIKSMKEAKILCVTDRDVSKKAKTIQENFGTQVIAMTSNRLNSYYENVKEEDAEKLAKEWISESSRVVEPSRAEIVKSAKMYFALKKAMDDNDADAVTVDCLGLYYGSKLVAYPCLALFQLNNEGSTGVCEADLDSTVTQLSMRYLTGRPGYVSDPVIDTGTSQIIYVHCVASNRVFGPEGLSNPYVIRSHSEDRKGASVQSLMPLGETVTTVKIAMREKMLAIHQGKTVANVKEDKGCRTKLAVEADVERILENYNFGKFGWHRVTVYGNFRKEVLNLAVLWGLEIIEEDEMHKL